MVLRMAEIDSMKFWMTQLSNRDEATREGYRIYFLKFCKWINKDPNKLILMKKQVLEHNGDRRENMVLEGKVKQFMSYLEHEAVTKHGKQGYGLGTRKMAYAGIVSFFDHNQYPLSMKRGDRPSGDALGSRIPEKTEIVKLVNTAKSRKHRAVILFLKDSGLRLSDVVKLKWKDIQDFGEGFFGFKLITQKKKVKALAFIGPEASDALNQLPRKKDRIFPIDATYLCAAISDLVKEAKLQKGLTAHGLRKYFNTELEAARVPKEYRYAMMGKKIGAYDENRQARLFEIYKQNYDRLRIFGVTIDEYEQRIKQAEENEEAIRELQKSLKELTESSKNWDILRKMFEQRQKEG